MKSQRFAFGLLLTLLLCACDHEDPCDEGVAAGPGACKAAPMEEKDAGEKPSDAGYDNSADAGKDSGSAQTAMSLGMDCTGNGDCSSDAPFCALQPGATKGYCTVRDCSTADDKCPSGYMCFNLGIASVPAFCLKKS
ncbi:MAG TPA: hypothetical protein VFN67_32205 [Polyangiales bacterium]|nr:hypothetical protein [Polyangiales bacterium]